MQWCHSNNDVVATTAPRERRGRDSCRGIGRRRREQRYLYVHGICMSNQVRMLQSVDHSDSQQLTELHWRTRRSCRIRRAFSTLQSSNYHYKCRLLRPGRKAGYCDKHLCLSGCLSASISTEPHVRFSQISLDASNGRGSVLLWRHYDMLCTSGFMDDVMLAGNGHKLATQKGVYLQWLNTGSTDLTLRSIHRLTHQVAARTGGEMIYLRLVLMETGQTTIRTMLGHLYSRIIKIVLLRYFKNKNVIAL